MYLDASGNVIADASVLATVRLPRRVRAGLFMRRRNTAARTKARDGAGDPTGARGFELTRRRRASSRIPIWRAFPRRITFFSAMGACIRPAKSSAATARRHARTHRCRADDFYRGRMARSCGRFGQRRRAAYARRFGAVQRGGARAGCGTFRAASQLTVISAPPPSSGGIVLISALNILESYPLATRGDRSAAWIHLATEAWRRAYMDRADYLGDPDYNAIPAAR